MTQAIFLSYALQDAGAARRICDALRVAGWRYSLISRNSVAVTRGMRRFVSKLKNARYPAFLKKWGSAIDG